MARVIDAAIAVLRAAQVQQGAARGATLDLAGAPSSAAGDASGSDAAIRSDLRLAAAARGRRPGVPGLSAAATP